MFNKFIPTLGKTLPSNSSLPDYALLYFDHLCAELQELLAEKSTHKAQTILEDALRKRSENILSWNDLYLLDIHILKLAPVESLPYKARSLRQQFRNIVGEASYQSYLASKPPNFEEGDFSENTAVLLADIEYLINCIHLGYSVNSLVKKANNRITSQIVFLIICGITFILFGILFMFEGGIQGHSLSVPSAIFFGGMGGLMSLQERYLNLPTNDGDPIGMASRLENSWSMVFLPAIKGALFSFLLFMMFIGDLVSGDLFPKFGTISNGTVGVLLLDVINHAAPISSADYAKHIIWSFLAGFAERLVPDTLTKLVSKKEGRGQ